MEFKPAEFPKKEQVITEVSETLRQATSPESTRQRIATFFRRDGKYGVFYKAVIDNVEYYLNPVKYDDGTEHLVLKRGSEVPTKE